MRNASRTSDENTAFRRLVEMVLAIPEHIRSEVFRLSVTNREHSDVTTSDVLVAIRKELEVLLPGENLPRLAADAHELDDTRTSVEVAFAIDLILLQSLTEGAD